MKLTFEIDDTDLENLKDLLKVKYGDWGPATGNDYARRILMARKVLQLSNRMEACCIEDSEGFREAVTS